MTPVGLCVEHICIQRWILPGSKPLKFSGGWILPSAPAVGTRAAPPTSGVWVPRAPIHRLLLAAESDLPSRLDVLLPPREGRCATPAAHIPCPHVLLALPAAVPIWLEALSPRRVPGSLGRHRGETCGQQEAAGGICSAGTVPRERCWSHPLLWWCLLITPCRGRAAKQGRAGGGCSRAVVAAPERGSRGLWDFMLSSQRLALERITLLVLHLQNFQGFLLQNRCKTLPSVHRAHDCARWRSKKKCLYGKAVITQPKSRHKAVLCKGRAVVTGADL